MAARPANRGIWGPTIRGSKQGGGVAVAWEGGKKWTSQVLCLNRQGQPKGAAYSSSFRHNMGVQTCTMCREQYDPHFHLLGGAALGPALLGTSIWCNWDMFRWAGSFGILCVAGTPRHIAFTHQRTSKYGQGALTSCTYSVAFRRGSFRGQGVVAHRPN